MMFEVFKRGRLGLRTVLALAVLAGAIAVGYQVQAQTGRRLPVTPPPAGARTPAAPPAARPAGHPAPAADAVVSDEVVAPGTVLMTRRWTPDGKTPYGTIWRTYQTWQTDIARLENQQLVRVDPMNPRGGGRSGASGGPNQTKSVYGSPMPPAGWEAADFDDSEWTRDPNPQLQLYGLVARLCVRGRFEVTNPTSAGEMNLTVRYRGGAVAYLNGKEIGRANISAGPIKDDTLAQDYPKEAYVDADGALIEQGIYHRGGDRDPEFLTGSHIEHGLLEWGGNWQWRAVSYDNASNGYFKNKDANVVERYRARTRKLEVKIAASDLRKGVNVLAIEIVRSPAWEGMFTAQGLTDKGTKTGDIQSFECYWDRCELEDVKLTAKNAGAPAPGVLANIAPPKGVHLWTHAAAQDVDPTFYADPNEPVAPIRLTGLKNGTFSGEVVVAASSISALAATASELKGPQGSTIPASAIQIGYAQIIEGRAGDSLRYVLYDPLDTVAPKGLTFSPWSVGRKFPPVQPVWMSVRVPKEAQKGTYKGTLTVNVAGDKATVVPVELEVVADWVLPDAASFATQVSLFECPEEVAKRYKVAMWSEAHWALLDKVFEVMGQMGTKDLYIPMVAKTHLGNPDSMVHWIKQSDGTYKLDTSIAERYLDLAVKHLGKVPRVCLFTSTRSQYRDPVNVQLHKPNEDQPICSEYDPATKQLKDFLPPKWGTPAAQVFWKPVIERMRQVLAARGLEQSMTFGLGADFLGTAGDNPDQMPNHVADLHALAPQARWLVSTHIATNSYNVGKNLRGREVLASHSWMFGFLFDVHWMDESDNAQWAQKYGWRNQEGLVELAASRSRSPTWIGDHVPNVTRCRVIPEAVMLARKYPNDPPFQGFGTWGADFWTDEWMRFDRYGNVALSETTMGAIVGAGTTGPVPTTRTRMLQEGLQEAELRVFVQNAILDADKKAKLGADLAKRCKELCDSRERAFSYFSNFRYSDSTSNTPRLRVIPDVAVWEDEFVKLAKLADEVEKALKR